MKTTNMIIDKLKEQKEKLIDHNERLTNMKNTYEKLMIKQDEQILANTLTIKDIDNEIEVIQTLLKK